MTCVGASSMIQGGPRRNSVSMWRRTTPRPRWDPYVCGEVQQICLVTRRRNSGGTTGFKLAMAPSFLALFLSLSRLGDGGGLDDGQTHSLIIWLRGGRGALGLIARANSTTPRIPPVRARGESDLNSPTDLSAFGARAEEDAFCYVRQRGGDKTGTRDPRARGTRRERAWSCNLGQGLTRRAHTSAPRR